MKMRTAPVKLPLLIATIWLTNCGVESPEKGSPEHIRTVTENLDDNVLLNADKNPADWITYGRTYQEQRHSPLDQITLTNVGDLGLAWAIELGTKRGIQATPLVVDGIMFFTGPWSVVYAVDVRKGSIIWKFDPEVPREKAPTFCCGVVNRGVALYKGTVIFGTLDGRLMALNAVDGTATWSVKTVTEEDGFKYSITGAPRIVKGMVLIGNGGAEYKARGYVTAYDALTGQQRWRFYTVPGDPSIPFEHPDLENAASTWNGEWWKQGGGGTVWDAIVYDQELDQVYIGVGNGTHWDRKVRSPGGGDNLYLSSIVALDPDEGTYLWHYQTTPGDTWDYTATQPIILTDLEIDGNPAKVLMQAPKNGFFYVIDRTNGQLISGEAYTYMNWSSGIGADARPIEVPGARYEDGRTRWITPSTHGGHNWHPMSYSPATGYVYIPTLNRASAHAFDPKIGFNSPDAVLSGVGYNISSPPKLYNETVYDDHPDAPQPGTSKGRLVAWDPVAMEEVWGIDQVFHYNGGVLTTAGGLLFQGDAEGMFIARNAETGEALWQFDVRSGVNAPPITYLVDGEQYITIAVGWGGAQGQAAKVVDRIHQGTIYTFKLNGSATPPQKLPPLQKEYTELRTDATPLTIGQGYNLFNKFCTGCHGGTGYGSGSIPDLTMSADAIYANYEGILLEGLLASEGMPDFGKVLTGEDVAQIKAYILFAARMLREQPDEFNLLRAQYQQLADQHSAGTRIEPPR